MNDPAIIITAYDDPPPDLARIVDDGLEAHNRAAAPIGEVMPLAAFARGHDGAVSGGAIGRTWGACCELLQLWVAEPHRARGLGTRLLCDFERRARNRGCTVFYLTTLSFQAPDFYRRHGYRVEAEIAGYPDGIRKFLMCKTEA